MLDLKWQPTLILNATNGNIQNYYIQKIGFKETEDLISKNVLRRIAIKCFF